MTQRLVPNPFPPSLASAREYNRHPAVKDPILARAGPRCEGVPIISDDPEILSPDFWGPEFHIARPD